MFDSVLISKLQAEALPCNARRGDSWDTLDKAEKNKCVGEATVSVAQATIVDTYVEGINAERKIDAERER